MNNNQKATKRALLTSVMALVMCVVMLVGTTFAWFTDTASTAVNKIQAGNLDVKLSYLTKENGWQEVTDTTKLFDDSALWEPGHTEVAYLKVENVGNLALKYQMSVNVANEVTSTSVIGNTLKLSDYIKMGVVEGRSEAFANREAARGAVQDAGNIATYTKDGNIAAGGDAQYVAMVVYMPETVGNEANYAVGKTVPSIELGVKLFATQDTVENDSFGNQYDKDAPIVYPAGVTEDSFAGATSVEYTDNLGNVVTSNKPAVAAYVDASGNVKYVGDIYAAIKGNASVIYCKKDATLRMRERLVDTNRTPDLTSDLTIYANGADFQYGQISMNMTDAGKAANVTVKVYDAKNIEVWGMTPNDGVTQNIVMENCTNIGTSATGDSGILMYITGNTGTVNATVNNCHVEKNSSGIYMSTNGSLTVTNSTFTECATGIKSSYKGNGTRTDRIENCVFTKCGCTAGMAGTTSWLSEDSSAFKYKNGGSGTITLTLKSNTITGTIGDKGDTQIANSVTVVNE